MTTDMQNRQKADWLNQDLDQFKTGGNKKNNNHNLEKVCTGWKMTVFNYLEKYWTGCYNNS